MNTKLLISLIFLLLLSCNKKASKETYAESSNTKEISNYLETYLNKEIGEEKKVDSLFNLVKNYKNSVEVRSLLAKLVFEYYFLKSNRGLNKSSKLLINLSEEVNDSINLGIGYRSRAFYFNNLKELDSSFKYYFKAEKIYEQLKENENYANVLLNKGIVEYHGGDNLRAELTLTKAYSIFNDISSNNKIFETLIALGNVADELNETEKSLIYYNKALEKAIVLDKKSNEFRKSICYNNIGYVYMRQQKFKEAIENFKLGLNLLSINEDPELYSNLIDNLALCKLKINDFKNLPEMFYKSLKIRDSINSAPNIIVSYIHLSVYYQEKNNFPKSINYSNKAVQLAKLSQNPLNLLSSLKQAAEVDIPNSKKITKEYIRLTDSLQIAERKSKDRFARIQLETDEIIQEKDQLEDKNRNLLYFFFGSVGLFGFLYYLRTQRAKNRELIYKQAQQRANEEIFNLMMSQQAIIDESRTQEKQKLARDLHDGVLGRMFGLRLSLDSVNRKNDEASLLKRLQIIDELKTIEQDIREISHDLNREKQVLINNFVSIVNNLIEEQKEKHNAKVSFFLDTSIHWDKIASAVKINLYRILQESLQNINKYANAKNINIGFVKNEDTIIFKISDDGIGFDANKKTKGIGTQNMVARTKECKGTIDIQSEIGEGTTITITIPTENK